MNSEVKLDIQAVIDEFKTELSNKTQECVILRVQLKSALERLAQYEHSEGSDE